MNKFKVVLALALALIAIAVPSAYAQGSITTTTLAAALPATLNSSSSPGGGSTVYLNASTGVNPPGFPYPLGGIGSPQGNAPETFLLVDQEMMLVSEAPATVGSIYRVKVERGVQGTNAATHNSGATVYVGPGSYFKVSDPVGACTASSLTVLPYISFQTGNVFNCPTSGPTINTWTKQGTLTTFTFTDKVMFVPPTACYTAVSANGTGTNGYTVAGASSTPVVQAQTSNSGTNTHTYVCTIPVPSRLTANKGAAITSVGFVYGVQTTGLGTQAATLASGTINSSIVFSNIAFPAAAASETASAVTPVRADAGSLVITPAVASFNVATTTAGAFYTALFTPATPLLLNTDLKPLLFTVTLQCTATSATITNSPGLTVHYIEVPQ